MFSICSNLLNGIVIVRVGAMLHMKDLLRRFMSGLRGQSATETDVKGVKGYGSAEQELGLPDADRTAARALVLADVAGRGMLELDETGAGPRIGGEICASGSITSVST